ncbi:hypothetical protein [Massilia sp. SYSU DXS3249]
MKLKFENLSDLAVQVASASSRGYSLIQREISQAGASALEARNTVRHTVSEAIDQIDTGKAAVRAKELAQSATAGTQKLTSQFANISRKADANHKEVADGIETVSMGLGITAGVTAAGAAIAAPTGLSAVGVALGVTSAPLIVTAAPVIAAAATTVGVVSGGAYFYSKWRSKNTDESKEKII